MQPQQNFGGSGSGSGDTSAAIVCAQCGAPMPREMRFCRSCGNRLGEGPAEYTETVRFPNATAAANGRSMGAFTPGPGAPIAHQAVRGLAPRRRRLGFTGMTWMWIALGLFFASGGALSTLVKNVGHISRGVTVSINRSYLGVDDLTSVEGGVTFGNVEPPGSPADLAGLVGGDIITSFDGHAVSDDDDLVNVLKQVPPGKTVEVIYLRDGEVKKTQLTTISREALTQMERAFANRPEGVGRLGFDTSDAHRVANPVTKTYGVQLDNFNSSGPAALAGIQKGDIITAVDKVPIRTVEELVARVHRALPYTTVMMTVTRGTEQLQIPVKLGK